MNRTMYCLFLFVLSVLAASLSASFVHPGLLHTQADFDRMAQKVAAKASPWIDSWNVLINNRHASLGYGPRPVSYVNRGSNCKPNNVALLFNDVAAAYQLAVRWKISGDNRYADKAVSVMNAWSSVLTGLGCQGGTGHDWILMAGIQGYQFANAGEIMRNYSGWNSTDFERFKSMMRNVFLPINEQFPRPLSEFANWDLADMASIMAIGVLCDDQSLFDQVVNYFKTGYGNGAILQAIYYVHPGYLGQVQESGRDQGHNTLDIAHLGVIAEQAWNQGVDLYSYANNRLLMGSEYAAKGNLINPSTSNFYAVPYATYAYVNWPTVFYQPGFSTSAIGTLRPCWAKIYNHYVNRMGLAAPYTQLMMNRVAPDGGGGNYGPNSGGFDQLGFETLTFTRDPIAQSAPPSNLIALLIDGNVVLSWFGSAFATSYNLKLGAPFGSTFKDLVSNITETTYTISGLPDATYYYYVTAVTPAGETKPSNKATISTKKTQLNTYLTFDASSGTVAADSAGNNNNGILVGGASFVSGKINNALSLNGNGYLTLPSNVIIGQADFTIAAWLRLNVQKTWARLFDFGFGNERWMMFAPSNGKGNACFEITVNTGAGLQSVCGPSPPTGQWVHIAITLSGQVGTYYLNGNVAGNGTIFLTPFQLLPLLAGDLTAQNWIGRSQYGSDPYLNGIVDDFRIYQGALTASQISALITQAG